jgi:hypothetical protein
VLDKTLALNHPATASPSLRSTLRRRGQFFWVCRVLMWPGVSVLTPIGARLCSLEVQSEDQKRCPAITPCSQVAAATCSRGVRHSTAQFTTLRQLKTMPCAYPVRSGRRSYVLTMGSTLRRSVHDSRQFQDPALRQLRAFRSSRFRGRSAYTPPLNAAPLCWTRHSTAQFTVPRQLKTMP